MDSDVLIDEYMKSLDVTASILKKYGDIRHWDIFGGVINALTIDLENGATKYGEFYRKISMVGRIFGDEGRSAGFIINKCDPESVERAVERAYHMMRVSAPNPEFKSLAEPPPKYPSVDIPYDPTSETLDFDMLKDVIETIIPQKRRDGRIKNMTYGLESVNLFVGSVNSNGVEFTYRENVYYSAVSFDMEEKSEKGESRASGSYSQSYIFFSELLKDLEHICDLAYKRAVRELPKIDVPSGEYPVILSPSAVSNFILGPIVAAVSGYAVYENRSFLKGELNKRISSEILTIRDDPWAPDAPDTAPFDDEGIPTEPHIIVENGILKMFLHNVYTANLFGTESTGNANRSISSSGVGIDTSNLFLEPGDAKVEDLIADIRYGIYFDYTYDHHNPVTGEFSGMVSHGYVIKNGEYAGSFRELMFGTDLRKLYKNIEAICSEVERKHSSFVPHVLVSKMRFSGK